MQEEFNQKPTLAYINSKALSILVQRECLTLYTLIDLHKSYEFFSCKKCTSKNEEYVYCVILLVNHIVMSIPNRCRSNLCHQRSLPLIYIYVYLEAYLSLFKNNGITGCLLPCMVKINDIILNKMQILKTLPHQIYVTYFIDNADITESLD